jgi:hypothetical protein
MLIEYKQSRLLVHIDQQLDFVDAHIKFEINKVISKLKRINQQLTWWDKLKFKLLSITPNKNEVWINSIEESLINGKQIKTKNTPLESRHYLWVNDVYFFNGEEIDFSCIFQYFKKKNKLNIYRKIFNSADTNIINLNEEEIRFLELC